MPLYEYQCGQCGTKVEKIQKFSDPPLNRCEKCGGGLERLLSSPAIHFKGSGWYVTDYARKSSAAACPTQTESAAHTNSAAQPAPSSSSADSK